MKKVFVFCGLVCVLCACSSSSTLSRSQVIYSNIIVEGEVANPGVHVVSNRGMVNALVAAGGLTPKSSSRVRVIGKKNSKSPKFDLAFTFTLIDVVNGGKGDLWIPHGWKVNVRNPFVGGAPLSVNETLENYVQSQAASPKFDMRLREFLNGEIVYEDIQE